jgi:DNA-binding CsgD family transcriptional regulator
MAHEASELAEATGDEPTMLRALVTAANFQAFADPASAAELLDRCLELGLDRHDDWVVTRTAMVHALVAWFQQDADLCAAHVAAYGGRMDTVGDRWTIAGALTAQAASLYPCLEHDRASALLAEAIGHGQAIGSPVVEGAARLHMALIEISAGEAAAALEVVQRARESLVAQAQFYWLPWAVMFEALGRAACGDLPEAAKLLQCVIEGEFGSARHAIVWAEVELAEVLRLACGTEAGVDQATHGLAGAEALQNPWLAAKARLTLGHLAARSGEWRAAERLHHEALDAIARSGLRLELASALEALAEVATGMRTSKDAARLLGAADRARRDRGPIAWPAHDAEVQQLRRNVRDAVGNDAYERAFAEGAAMTDDAIVAWSRRGRGPRVRPAAGWDSLTPAELEVVRHAAAGLSNPEIAERLFIARATVKAHLAHIYAKLGVANRTELAARAAERLEV